jgi:3-methylfumaryl-CoA hydratase
MFADQPFTLCGEPSADGKSAKLWTIDHSGALATNARAEFY